MTEDWSRVDRLEMPQETRFFISDSSCPHCGARPSPSSTNEPSRAVPRGEEASPREEVGRDDRKRKRNNGWYLSIIVGNNIDLSMSSTDRFLFKKDYERFKLRVTLLICAAVLFAFLLPSRAADSVASFLMVWYYCTLTIRESILMINGSNMHWWWVVHHYLATALAAVTVTWPEDAAYLAFRRQFGLFALYICLVQQLQYQYQSGCLRRLHALGSLHADVDLTVEGFASWMFHGLTFLLPFLVIAYFFEMYNAYTLFHTWRTMESSPWQVVVLCLLFFVVGVGNLFMVSSIVWSKFAETPAMRKASLRSKYPSMMSISTLLRRSSEESEKEKEKAS